LLRSRFSFKCKVKIVYSGKYEEYPAGNITDHELFDAEEGLFLGLRPYVEQRITELEEDLFFENQRL